LRQHGTRSLLKFDLSSLMMMASKVQSATLNLFSLNALRAFENPTPGLPVTTDLRQVTDDWDEQTVTWDSRPDVAMTPAASVVQTGVGDRVTFDVTDLVTLWLADLSSNFGSRSRNATWWISRFRVRVTVMSPRFTPRRPFPMPRSARSSRWHPWPVPAAFGLLAMAGLGALRLRRRAA
jgi:MYXO-CTERM domain-containing protein